MGPKNGSEGRVGGSGRGDRRVAAAAANGLLRPLGRPRPVHAGRPAGEPAISGRGEGAEQGGVAGSESRRLGRVLEVDPAPAAAQGERICTFWAAYLGAYPFPSHHAIPATGPLSTFILLLSDSFIRNLSFSA